MGCETVTKTSILREVARPLMRKVIRNTDITIPTRRLCVDSLLFSKSAFQAGTWPSLNTAEYITFKKPVMVIYRALAGCDDLAHGIVHSHLAILRQIKAMRPAVLLRYYRIKTAMRLAVKQPLLILVALLAAKPARRSWLKALEADLLWIATYTSTFAELLAAGDRRVAPFFQMCRAEPKGWIGHLEKSFLRMS